MSSCCVYACACVLFLFTGCVELSFSSFVLIIPRRSTCRIPRPFFAQRSLPFPSFSSFSPSQSLHRPLASSRKCTCDNSPRSHSNHPVAETQEKARGRGREAREGERRAKKRKGRHRRARKTGKGKSNADLKYSTTVM